MPSKSKKQARFMAAVANNPEFARKAGVSQDVGREFADADEGRNFAGGGVMPSYYDSKSGKPGKAVKKYRGGDMVSVEGKVRDERNLTEEDERVRRRRPRDEKEREDREAQLDRIDREERDVMYKKGGKVQTKKDRSDESKGSTKPRGWGIASKGWAGRY